MSNTPLRLRCRCWELSRSQALAGDLEKRFPEDTFARFTYVPVLRALSSLNRVHPADSIEQLQIALRYELAVNGLSRNLYLGGLHSAYVRGEALAAGRRYGEAAADFQKILDHRGVVGADPLGALAHLKLGRAFSLCREITLGRRLPIRSLWLSGAMRTRISRCSGKQERNTPSCRE
jgi:hypothetical protein